ncbi:hypothetical protein V8B97DRAFT_627310 [Scleroderma yunnanense]
MAWGVFYRPPESSFVREYPVDVHPLIYPPSQPPQFRRPLAQTVLNDPAFSSDPRSHPHFPLADARSYKELPPKPPRSTPSVHDPSARENITCLTSPAFPQHSTTLHHRLSPLALSVSLEHDPHEPILTSSTVSPTTSTSSSPSEIPRTHISSTLPGIMPNFRPPQYTKFPSSNISQPLGDHPRMPYTISTPAVQQHVVPRLASAPNRTDSAPDLPATKKQSKIKNLVRRLTKRDNLDRIDELDETDPFGLGFHHSGPYEAITNNLAKLVLPHNGVNDPAGRMHGSKRKGNHTCTPHPAYTAINDPFTEADNTSDGDSAHNVQVETVPIAERRYYDPATNNIQPDHIGAQILRDQSADPIESHPPTNQDFTSPPAPRVHYFGDIIPQESDIAPSHISSVSASYVPYRGQSTTRFPSNYREPGACTPSPPPSPRPPPSDTPYLISQPIRPLADSPPRQVLPPKSVRSLDMPRNHSGYGKPPRVQHLPKRLVMPAPLQPQLQPYPAPPAPPRQLRYAFPKASDEVHPARWLVDATVETPVTNRGRKLLRKRSASLPRNIHLPVQSSIPRTGPGLATGNSPPTTAFEAKRAQQGTRGRRLSKRKIDI